MKRIVAGLLATLLAACAATTDGDAEQGAGALTAGARCGTPAGTLTIMAIPTTNDLDWTTPNTLIRTALRESGTEADLVKRGLAGTEHFIGHTLVQLDCGDLSIPLTGQTGGGDEWKTVGDGFGAMFRDFPGTLNEFPGEANTKTLRDVELRTQSGHLLRMSFEVNRATCLRLHAYHDEYVRRGAYKHFVPSARPRRFEGGGCAGFGASFIDVADLLPRSQYTPLWAKTVLVGQHRFADFLGSGTYRSGSNLLAKTSSGAVVTWPRDVGIPARQLGVVVPLGATLDHWTGPEDDAFDIPNLPTELRSSIPLTIYDPQMIARWVDATWQLANGLGKVTKLGRSWTANMVGGAREIITDATCTSTPTGPFESDRDDLYEDAQ